MRMCMHAVYSQSYRIHLHKDWRWYASIKEKGQLKDAHVKMYVPFVKGLLILCNIIPCKVT